MDAKKTGSLIADLRKQSNKTQKELANELHISSATVSKWERGIGFPDISLIEPLAKCLNISKKLILKKVKRLNECCLI